MNASVSWRMTEQDMEFYERELASFIPDRVFDAHTHLWEHHHARYYGVPDDVGYSEYRQLMEDLHPGRQISALFIPAFNDQEKIGEANAWTAKQTAIDPTCRGEFFVKPQDDPEWVRDEVRRLRLHGLKCYHTLASVNPTWEAQIPDYLPERLIKVANEEGWVVTLHMVRSRAVADPGNIHWIRYYCETYPNMTLILAHSARGFQPAHNLEGLPKLTGLDNLYFDTSANCEAMAHQAIIRIIGHQRLMYGSDLPASHQRGRSTAVSDTFLWLAEQTPVWNEKHLTIKPTMVGLEHLRSLKWACWSERLSDTAIEDIFWKNASGLFGS